MPMLHRPVEPTSKLGQCSLGESTAGPFQSIGPVTFDIVTRSIEIDELRYSRGFHVLADAVTELTSAEAHIHIQSADGADLAGRLLNSTAAMILQGNGFEFRAGVLTDQRKVTAAHLTLGLNLKTAKLVWMRDSINSLRKVERTS